MTLLRLESQPNFPNQDISSDDANALEGLLAIPEFVTASHESAKMYLLYRLGHRVINSIARSQLEEDKAAALSYGIELYEATSVLVRPTTPYTLDDEIARRQKSGLALTAEEIIPGLIEAKDRFEEQTPNTAQLFGVNAMRYHRQYRDYVLAGSGIARDIEVDASNNEGSSLPASFDFDAFEEQFRDFGN